MSAESNLLAEVPFFALLDEQEREELAAQVDLVRFSAGQIIFNYGDPGDSMYVIRSGEVEVFIKDDTGERIVVERPSFGDFFGELSLLDGGARTASVLAVEDVEALLIDRADLELFLKLHPTATIDLLTAMGKRLRITAELLRRTASRNVNVEHEEKRTSIEKAADWIAQFSGSIPFLVIHVVIFTVWIVANTDIIPGLKSFDPFPFGLLTMAVSLEAIILSVFVLLSQNRQVEKDRIRSDIEYEVNLKAELEIAHLHEKVDTLHTEVLTRLNSLEKTAAPVSK
jgi:uncharacterized membrane protein